MNQAAKIETKVLQTVSMKEAAVILEIGPRKLFEALRELKILQQDNQPMPHLIRAGYFRSVIKGFARGPVSKQYTLTLVTSSGLAYLREQLDKHQAPGTDTNTTGANPQ